MGAVNICPAPVGSPLWSAGEALLAQGQAMGTAGGAETFLGSAIVNGFDGNAMAVWGAIASMGAMTFDLPQAIIGSAGMVVGAITGMLSAAKDPTQGGACPPTVNGVQVTSAGQLNQLINQTFYNLTGMSPMQWTASNGAYSTSGTSGTDTSSITTVVGGYTTSGRQ